MVTIYGIKNCDTVKRARKLLDMWGQDYRFHDFRSDGLDRAMVEKWVAQLGWEALLNKRSTSWRQLTDEQKSDLDAEKAIDLMIEHPTLIKRPVLDVDGHFHVGFKEAAYHDIFK
jgi:arsenate reductase